MSAITKAYDTILDTVHIDQDSIRWASRDEIEVSINGEPHKATVWQKTEQGIRDSVMQALKDYCAVHAVMKVVGAEQ